MQSVLDQAGLEFPEDGERASKQFHAKIAK